MASLDFRTQAISADENNETLTINIGDADGRNVETLEIFVPTETQIAIYLASYDAGNLATLAATFEFAKTIFDPEDWAYLSDRLKDRDDPFELGTLTDVLLGVIQAAAARPTQRSTGSTASRRAGGPKLTDHLPPKAQTRSRSPRAASATSSTRGASSD